MSNNFTTFQGKFLCKICKVEVKTMRVYTGTGMASWMCPQKHLSEVQLFQVGYKKKKDYERKN